MKANGAATDVLAENREKADELQAHLRAWEAEFPVVEPTLITDGMPENLVEQLRSIGYLK